MLFLHVVIRSPHSTFQLIIAAFCFEKDGFYNYAHRQIAYKNNMVTERKRNVPVWDSNQIRIIITPSHE